MPTSSPAPTLEEQSVPVQPEAPAVEASQEAPVATESGPLGPDGEYNGYSEAGMLEDKKNEGELVQLLDSYSKNLDGIEERYFSGNNPGDIKRGVAQIKALREELDRHLEGPRAHLKNAKNHNSLYLDTFLKKYHRLLFKYEV